MNNNVSKTTMREVIKDDMQTIPTWSFVFVNLDKKALINQPEKGTCEYWRESSNQEGKETIRSVIHKFGFDTIIVKQQNNCDPSPRPNWFGIQDSEDGKHHSQMSQDAIFFKHFCDKVLNQKEKNNGHSSEEGAYNFATSNIGVCFV